MITLLRLRADHFKGLRDLDLSFPRSGSLLIEGHNEAGKSTLFEAAFVALYGKALVGEDDARPRLEDLIAFDSAQGWVELTFEVGATHIVVSRQFWRAKPQVARITVARAGQADETRHGISAVNDRVLREIGGLDADALRNSCFVEQKELGRLESLRREERERAIERLLGLDRLTKLAESYRLSEREAEDAVRHAGQRLDLAQASEAAREANIALAAAREEIDTTQASIWFATLADLERDDEHGEQAVRQYADALRAQQASLERAQLLDGLLRDIDAWHADTEQSQTLLERALATVATSEQDMPAAELQVAKANEVLDGVKRRDTLAELLRAPGATNDTALGAFAAQVRQREAEYGSAKLRFDAGVRTSRRLIPGAGALAIIGWILFYFAPPTVIFFPPYQVGLVIIAVAVVIVALVGVSISPRRRAKVEALKEMRRAQDSLALAQSSTVTSSDTTALTQLGYRDPDAAHAALADLTNRFVVSREEAEHALVTATAALAVARERAQMAQNQLQSLSVTRPQRVDDPKTTGELPPSTAEHGDAWQPLLDRARQLGVVRVDESLTHDRSSGQSLNMAGTLLRERVAQARSAIDTSGIDRNIEQLHQTLGAEQQAAGTRERMRAQVRDELNSLLARRSIPAGASLTAVKSAWPRFGVTESRDLDAATQHERDATERVSRLAERARVLAQQLGLNQSDFADVDLAACEEELQRARHDHVIAGRARQAIQRARQQVVQRVLPVTERNMRLILPLLTAGRYHDVRLTPPEENAGSAERADYRIYLFERSAGRYVAKSIFSGGARDQCSLALRLAFALATLPQELGIAPGFLFLDEPLSAFDNERGAALVELLTQGMVANTFAQVVVISHQHAYSAADFRYHVRMERGRIVASDLPDATDLAFIPLPERV